MSVKLLQAVMCLVLGSCASPTQQKPPEPIDRRAQCALAALTAFPEAKQAVTVVPEKKIPDTVSCKLNEVITCGLEDKTVPAVKTTRDGNFENRTKRFQACLKE